MRVEVLIIVFLVALGISYLNKKNREKVKSNNDKIRNRINNRKNNNKIKNKSS